MSYISIDDQKTLVPQNVMRELTDDNADGTLDTAMIEQIIKEACEEVDGYLRGRYNLPFTKTPTLVAGAAKQIARYKLYERRPEGFEIPKAVRDGYTDTTKRLEKMRDGKISLGVGVGSLKGALLKDDGEFHVKVRPSKDKMGHFGREVLDRW